MPLPDYVINGEDISNRKIPHKGLPDYVVNGEDIATPKEESFLSKAGGFFGDVAEGAALMTGDVLKIANPAIGAAVGAGAYTAVKGAERGIRQLTGNIPKETAGEELLHQGKDLKEGLEMMTAGGFLGKAIGGGYQFLKRMGEHGAEIVVRPLPAVTEKGAMKKVGHIIKETTPTDALSLAAAKKAAEVKEQIPGLQFSRGQEYGSPSIIQSERATIKSSGEASDVFTEKLANNNRVIRQSWDDVIDTPDPKKLAQAVGDKYTHSGTTSLNDKEIAEDIIHDAVGNKVNAVQGYIKNGEFDKAAIEAKKAISNGNALKMADGPITEAAVNQHLKTLKEIGGEDILNITEQQQAGKLGGGVSKSGKATVDDLIDFAKNKKDVMDKQAAGLFASPTSQETGGKLIGQIDTAANASKTTHKEAYANIGNIPINSQPIQDTISSITKEITPVNSSRYPVATIEKINSLIQSRNKLDEYAIASYGKKWNEIAEKSKEALLKNIPELRNASLKQEVGFQDWLDIRKELASEYWDAMQGAQPNRILARNIQRIQEGVTNALEVSTKDTPAEGVYQKAVSLFKDYADKYYTGKIAKVRQKGIEATGLKIPQGDIPSQFTTPDGADSLIKAIGKDNAQISMRDYFNRDLGDKLRGDLSPVNVGKWLSKNREVLGKYGLMNEYTNLLKSSADYQVVNKLLGADVQSAIGSTLGKGKDIGINAGKLLKMVEGNPQAKRGLQKGFGDYIINEIETTEKTRAGDFVISNAKVVNTLEKYKPAIDAIYADNPAAIKRLHVIQDAIEIMNKTAKSPTGGGSDTFELGASKYAGLMRYVGNRLGATMLGAGAGSYVGGLGAAGGAAVGMVGWDVLSKHSQANVNKFLLKAMFDPDFSNTLIMMASGAPKKTIESRVAQQMTTLGIYSFEKLIGDPFGLKATNKVIDYLTPKNEANYEPTED